MVSAQWSLLHLLRENPDKLKWNQKVRKLDEKVIDYALELDLKWREVLKEVNKLKHEKNIISKKLLKTTMEDRNILINKAREITQEIEKLEAYAEDLKKRRDEILLGLPNVLHETVPIGIDENDNVPIRFYGKPKVWRGIIDQFLNQTRGHNIEYEIVDKPPIGHAEYVEKTGLADIERAAKVSGSRFYYLIDDLVWLDFALISYALDYLKIQGFKILETPLMIRKEAYEGVTSLEDFANVIYKIEGENLYLIATSEHAIAAMHMNEVLEKSELPLLYAGVSPCFRKEAGAHGKDTKGIFRVHQFNKVEQFVFCLPEDSWKWHEKLIENAEKLWQGLEIPYRVVNICTGEIGVVAAKKYDLEAWMPAQGRYREVVSCSNCTDWQSYRLNIRYAEKRGLPSEGYVHTLNSTAIATSRAITAIIENHQQEDGIIVIPKVLRKYLEKIEGAPKEKIIPAQR